VAVRTYEVFLRKGGKEPFEHAGSLDAPDDELAVLLAREAYVRRGEGEEMWLVDRAHLVVADPALLAVNADRPHRHNDGSVVAARRKAKRAQSVGS
jgi:ring-1,2-phenylacetyl-CoA epoxidase subunit PaaB